MKIKILIKNQKGAALVEFGLILPLLILLIFGVIEFGLLLFNQQVITNAAREGARAGIVARENRFNVPLDNADAVYATLEQNVIKYWSSHLVTFGDTIENARAIEILIWNNPDPETYPDGAGAFDEVDDIAQNNRCVTFKCPLKVRITYDYKFLVLSNLGFGTKKLVGESIMRME